MTTPDPVETWQQVEARHRAEYDALKARPYPEDSAARAVWHGDIAATHNMFVNAQYEATLAQTWAILAPVEEMRADRG